MPAAINCSNKPYLPAAETIRMNNVNDTYFGGYYKELWKSIIPDELTVKEIGFMIPYFNLGAGSRVLDLMCGYGRHTLALGRQQISVTAVDNLPEYIREIEEAAAAEQLPVEAICSGVLDFTGTGSYDLALCMGNSLNFFNAADTTRLLKNTASLLKPGGHLLINSWSMAEIVFRNFSASSWTTIGDIKFLSSSRLLFHPTRIETENIFIPKEGESETRQAVDYIFSMNEMESMLNEAGLHLEEAFSIPGRKKFTAGEPRAYLVAVKK